MKSIYWQASAALLMGVVAVSGCGNNGATDNTTGGANSASNGTTTGSSAKLTGAGSTFINPLMAKWTDLYKQKNGVEINYASIGSGAGIKQLKSNTVDFGATDVPLDDKAIKEMPTEVAQIPVTAGAVAVVYNVPGVDNLKLNGAVLADIFLGVITRWNDPKNRRFERGRFASRDADRRRASQRWQRHDQHFHELSQSRQPDLGDQSRSR